MKEGDLPLVRGGKLPKEALHWLEESKKIFQAPRGTSSLFVENLFRLHRARRLGSINTRESKDNVRTQTAA
jgi:hypothetical protein